MDEGGTAAVCFSLLIVSFCPSVRQGGVWHCRRHRGGRIAAVRLRHLLPDQESANQHQVTPTTRPDSAHLGAPTEHRQTNVLEDTKHSIQPRRSLFADAGANVSCPANQASSD